MKMLFMIAVLLMVVSFVNSLKAPSHLASFAVAKEEGDSSESTIKF